MEKTLLLEIDLADEEKGPSRQTELRIIPADAEQNDNIFTSSDKIVLIFPIHHNIPHHSIVKIIQSSLTEGIGYRFDSATQKNVGCLQSKTIFIVSSIGKADEPEHYFKGIEELFKYCGATVKKCILTNITPSMTQLEFTNHESKIKTIAREIYHD